MILLNILILRPSQIQYFIIALLVCVAGYLHSQQDPCFYVASCDESEEHNSFDYDIVDFDKVKSMFGEVENDEMIHHLLRQVEEKPKEQKDILIVIHGMWGNDSGNFKRTSKMLKRGYLEPNDTPIGAMLSFKWPSNNYKYKNNKAKVKEVASNMAKEVISLARKIQMLNTIVDNESNIHLLCHSLGNFLLEEMIQHVDEQQFEHELFDQIILAAPDLDTYAFEGEYSLTNLKDIANRTTVYFNRADVTLKVSETLNDRKRLGRSGPSPLTQFQNGIYFIDATNVDDERSLPDKFSSHSYYRNSPSMELDIRMTLAGTNHEAIKRRSRIEETNVFLINGPIPEALTGQ